MDGAPKMRTGGARGSAYGGSPKIGMGDTTGATVGTAVLGPGIGTAVGSVLPLASVFHTSAAGPNTDAAKAVLPLALQGNAAAIKAIYKRATYIRTVSSAAPWKDALAAIQVSHPEWVQAALSMPGIQEEWVVNVAPEEVLPAVQRYNLFVTGGGGSATGSQVPGTNVTRASAVPTGSLVTLALIGAGAFALSKVFGGGPRRRRR